MKSRKEMSRVLLRARILAALKDEHAYRSGHVGGEDPENCPVCELIVKGEGR